MKRHGKPWLAAVRHGAERCGRDQARRGKGKHGPGEVGHGRHGQDVQRLGSTCHGVVRQGKSTTRGTTHMSKSNGNSTALADTTNDAADIVAAEAPYVAHVTIEGVAPILFHRWSNEAVAAKASAAKGSTAKKTDDVESYIYRCAAWDAEREWQIDRLMQYLTGALS